MSRLTQHGTAEPVSRDQIFRRDRGQGNVHFPCSADDERDWQPDPVDPCSAICDDNAYIHIYIHTYLSRNVCVCVRLFSRRLAMRELDVDRREFWGRHDLRLGKKTTVVVLIVQINYVDFKNLGKFIFKLKFVTQLKE